MTHIELVSKAGEVVGRTVVDPGDAESLSAWIWRLHQTGYAWRCERPGGRSAPLVAIFMHREILGLPRIGRASQGDHINRDRLDNRKANLRVVDHGTNMRNRGSFAGSTSSTSGVYRDGKRWRAQVKVAGIRHDLGSFVDEASAAAVVREFRAGIAS